MYCSNCKKELNIKDISEKDWTTTFILSLFMGMFGLHRFYTGYIKIGIAQAMTLGGFGLWSLIDWISICINTYEDCNNKKLKDYVKPLGIGALSVIFIFLFILSLVMIFICLASISMVNTVK